MSTLLIPDSAIKHLVSRATGRQLWWATGASTSIGAVKILSMALGYTDTMAVRLGPAPAASIPESPGRAAQ
jgi:hypothetical protein